MRGLVTLVTVLVTVLEEDQAWRATHGKAPKLKRTIVAVDSAYVLKDKILIEA